MIFRSFMFVSLIVLFVSAPVLFTNHDDSSKYFVYEYTFTDYENGKPSFGDRIVFKLISVNETAYKIELIRYNRSTPIGETVYESYMLLLNQTNAIIEIDQQSYLNILDLGFME